MTCKRKNKASTSTKGMKDSASTNNNKQLVGGARKDATPNRMQSLMRQLGIILLQIHDCLLLFKKQEDVEGLGHYNYYEIIEKPMYLETIKNMMEGKDEMNRYMNVREIYEEVRLVFENAMKYNADSNEDEHVMAKTLQQLLEKWLNLLLLIEEETANGMPAHETFGSTLASELMKKDEREPKRQRRMEANRESGRSSSLCKQAEYEQALREKNADLREELQKLKIKHMEVLAHNNVLMADREERQQRAEALREEKEDLREVLNMAKKKHMELLLLNKALKVGSNTKQFGQSSFISGIPILELHQ